MSSFSTVRSTFSSTISTLFTALAGLTVAGALTLSSATVTGNLVPTTDNVSDIGSAAKGWKDLYIAGNIGVGTSTPQAALGFGLNKKIELFTDENTQNLTGLIRLKFMSNEAKATIAYVDENNTEVIWLQAHNYLTFPTTQHKHFSIEAADGAGLKQTRLGISYGSDIGTITFNQSNLVINRNAGQTNGNLEMGGGGLGGNFLHNSDFSFYPQSGTNSTVAFRVAESSGNLRLFGIGTSTVFMDDTVDITGNLYASGNFGVGTTAPANDLVIARSGSSGIVNGPELVLRQNQTTINTTTNSNVGEIFFAGDDLAGSESGFGAKIRGQAAASWNGTTNDYPTDLLFFTQRDGGGAGLAERMRITHDGNVIVGASSANARLTVSASETSPLSDIFAVTNQGNSSRYLTVSSTAALMTVPITTNSDILSTDTGDIGWSVQSAANQACSTTCTNACVMGFANAAIDGSDPVSCSDATADTCLCAGAS